MQRLLKWFRTGPDAAPTPYRPRAGKPVLRARGLTHAFGEGETRTTALHPLGLELYRGQIALLMGPSGSGKSTLLAALSGLLRPDGGQVLALGKDLWALSAQEQERFRLRHFGFIFQGYNLFPALTARQQSEIILRWGEGLSGGETRRRADDMLASLGLGRKGHLRPAQLSGGEKQRVAVGRALVKGPDFCFADEPTSALDWEHGRQVIEMLRDAARQRGATVLVVSHDARLVPYADRVFRLDDGHLAEQTPEVIPLRPAAEGAEGLPAAV